MAARTPKVTPRYIASLARVGVRGAQRRALAATITRLCRDDDVPGPLDSMAIMPPVRWAFVRRVRNYNLWLWYDVRSGLIILLAVTSSPPVPSD